MDQNITDVEAVLNKWKSRMYEQFHHEQTEEASMDNDPPSSSAKSQNQQLIENPNLKLNPVAYWMERNRILNNIKANNNNSNNNSNIKHLETPASLTNQGPFANQQEKSKEAKITAAANKVISTEMIDLDTDNESNNSDVIMIPVTPPPTYTVDDSDDEDGKTKVPFIMQYDENALDSTDVQMPSTSTSFIKLQSFKLTDSADKCLDNTSRCTSPCSTQSSDDFMGQTARSQSRTKRLRKWRASKTPASKRHMSDTEGDDSADKCLYYTPICTSPCSTQSSDVFMGHTDRSQSRTKRLRKWRASETPASKRHMSDTEGDDSADKCLDYTPICTSPCSTQSSDVFMGHTDRSQSRTKRLRKWRASKTPASKRHMSDTEGDDSADKCLYYTPICTSPCSTQSSDVFMGHTDRSQSRTKRLRKWRASETPASKRHMSDTEGNESEIENLPTSRDIAEKREREEEAIPEKILSKLAKVLEDIDKQNGFIIVHNSIVDIENISSDSSDDERESRGQSMDYCPDKRRRYHSISSDSSDDERESRDQSMDYCPDKRRRYRSISSDSSDDKWRRYRSIPSDSSKDERENHGHSLDYSLDKWRSYHSITEANSQPNSTITYNTQKYFCNCCEHSHLYEECRTFMEYPPTVSTIKSPEKAYNDVVLEMPHNGIAFNLMNDYCEEYNLNLINQTSSDKY